MAIVDRIFFFFEKPAPSLFRNHIRLPSCQKLEKSKEWIPRNVKNSKKGKNTPLMAIVDRNIFFEKPALSLFRNHIRLPSCQN